MGGKEAAAVSSGAVTLGEIADRLPTLEVACDRCGRHGRLAVRRLIEQYGTGAKLPDLRAALAGDCPRVGAASIYEQCRVGYPQLVALGQNSTLPSPAGEAG
jgi:hypothetical protein